MRRILLTIAYEGTAYAGFQRQENALAIEEVLEDALRALTGEEILLIGGSRTDAGVHAKGNVGVFDTASPIPPEKFCFAVNKRLPEDIRIIRSEEVPPDFHPHRIPSVKTYEYRLLISSVPDPLRRSFVWHQYKRPDVEAMREAAAYLTGEHDFSAFCSAGSQVRDKVRKIYSLETEEAADEVRIRVSGSGFLYNMVRIIVGTLLQAGLHRIPPEKIKLILNSRDRTLAGPTAPARGLTLLEYRFEGG